MHKSEWYNPLPTQADNTRLNKVLSADAAPKLPFRQALLISKKKVAGKCMHFLSFDFYLDAVENTVSITSQFLSERRTAGDMEKERYLVL